MLIVIAALFVLGAVIGRAVRPVFGPDDFARDWYGWLTNQAGHLALGVLAVWLVAVAGLVVAGDLPPRLGVLALALAPFVGFELALRGTAIDTAQDVGFYAIGAGAVALNWPLTDPLALVPWVAAAILGLAAGVVARR